MIKELVYGHVPVSTDYIPTRESLLSRLADWEDQDSWRDFYQTYRRLFYTTAMRAGLQPDAAEDIVQLTVLEVAKRIPSFKYDPSKCAFKTWLYIIVRRRIADYFRKGRRQPVFMRDDPAADSNSADLEDLPDPASIDPDPIWDLDWKKNLLRAAMDRVKGRVKAQYYQAYDLLVVQHRSALETSRAIGINLATVYLAKHRVEKLLRKEIQMLRDRYG